MLEVNGAEGRKELYQSAAITRYLGEKLGEREFSSLMDEKKKN
jgi:hypothetical protein